MPNRTSAPQALLADLSPAPAGHGRPAVASGWIARLLVPVLVSLAPPGAATLMHARVSDVGAGTPVVYLNPPSVDSFPYDVKPYTDWAEDCANVVDGSSCTRGSGPSTTWNNMLFSWGEEGDTRNSSLRVTYIGTASAEVASLTLASIPGTDDQPNLLGPAAGWKGLQEPKGDTQGFGSMVVYEQPASGLFEPAPALRNHSPAQQRVTISLQQVGGSLTELLSNQAIFTSATSSDRYLNADETGFVRHPVDRTFEFVTPVTLGTNDRLILRFFESTWDNSAYTGDAPLPDAYYGPMSVTLNAPAADAPAITVATAPTLIGRAGTDPITATMTVTNTGDPGTTLNGQFNAVVDQPNLTASPNADQPFAVTQGAAGASRGFSFTPQAALGLATATPQTVSLDQTITHDDANVASPLTETVTGTTVGPVLGLSRGATDPLDAAQALPYESTIDLGSIAIDQGPTFVDLVLANVFGQAFGNNLTGLSVFNIGIFADAGFTQPSTLFRIASGDFTGTLEAQTQAPTLRIAFDPVEVGFFTGFLRFSTDMNRAFGDQTNPFPINFTLQGRGTSGPVPVPATLLLLCAGLLAMSGLRAGRWPWI